MPLIHFACHGILDERLPLESGLARAFQYAGAWTVISSLRSISDERAALLMKSFYSY